MREVRKDKKQARKKQNAEENHYDNIFQQNKIETDKKFKDKRKYDVSHILAMFLRLVLQCFCVCLVRVLLVLLPHALLFAFTLNVIYIAAFYLFECSTFCLFLPNEARRHSYERTNRLILFLFVIGGTLMHFACFTS
jgi:hypothetical protein